MSTSLNIYLESLDLNNYVSLMIVTTVAYDYALTFLSEMEHIWRRWTWVSSAYLLVRYGGLIALLYGNCFIPDYLTLTFRLLSSTTALSMFSSLDHGSFGTDHTELEAGSSFVPGPLWVRFFSSILYLVNSQLDEHHVHKLRCYAFLYLANWTGHLFRFAADLVMIFRVYALYGQSKKILAFLLFIYSGEVVASFISGVVYTIPGNASMTIPPAPYPSVCELQYASWNWGRYSVIPQVVLQGVMCLLAIYQCLGQSLQLYKATKRWQLNQYFKLLVNQGLLYFLINFLQATITNGLFSINFGQTVSLILSSTLLALIYALNPRFILSIRELYSRTVVDTGFGMLSGRGVGTMTNIGTRLHFAGTGTRTGETSVGVEEISMEETRARRFVDM
ncbi:hypothetical protein HD554DRAFT_924570 [Boletus coccyginus]|nr:hypothetical protein HD554DRAFT_924570 [Boletus coccyginus]